MVLSVPLLAAWIMAQASLTGQLTPNANLARPSKSMSTLKLSKVDTHPVRRYVTQAYAVVVGVHGTIMAVMDLAVAYQ